MARSFLLASIVSAGVSPFRDFFGFGLLLFLFGLCPRLPPFRRWASWLRITCKVLELFGEVFRRILEALLFFLGCCEFAFETLDLLLLGLFSFHLFPCVVIPLLEDSDREIIFAQVLQLFGSQIRRLLDMFFLHLSCCQIRLVTRLRVVQLTGQGCLDGVVFRRYLGLDPEFLVLALWTLWGQGRRRAPGCTSAFAFCCPLCECGAWPRHSLPLASPVQLFWLHYCVSYPFLFLDVVAFVGLLLQLMGRSSQRILISCSCSILRSRVLMISVSM